MWSSIKSILKDNTTKCVIVEDGEPKYVVLSFAEYQQLQKSGNNGIVGENLQKEEDPAQSLAGIEAGPPQFSEADLGGEDKINGEIQEMTDVDVDELAQPAVRLEDLPF